MSFRKRNIGLTNPRDRDPGQIDTQTPAKDAPSRHIPGVRPSPLDGRPTTSTGTQSLDELLSGHAGLALGNCLIVEENGTTDFAGTLLRYYAAEGVIQGHKIEIVGVGEQWGRELPGLVGEARGDLERGAELSGDKEKMKIAWRYERLGEFGVGGRGGIAPVPSFVSGVHKEPPSSIGVFCPSFNCTNEHSSSDAQSQPNKFDFRRA